MNALQYVFVKQTFSRIPSLFETKKPQADSIFPAEKYDLTLP
jgi:hypothetical protein